MIFFRLAKRPHHLDLSGKGAEINGSRWNNEGTPLLFVASSLSLCMAEVLVHLGGVQPLGFFLLEIETPDGPFDESLKMGDPKNFTENMVLSKRIGDSFASEGKWLGLWVPSAPVPGEFNLVLNPRHADFSKVKIVKNAPFDFDPRFFQT